MLSYPPATLREEKLAFIDSIIKRLTAIHGENIIAIGAYGSMGKQQDLPFSDIELHIVSKDGYPIKGHEFVLGNFKMELSCYQKSEIFQRASRMDDSWPIWAGSFIEVLPFYDPENLFDEVKKIPYQASDDAFSEMMRKFMIWEPYETIGKIRNNYQTGNLDYLPLGAKDLAWQTAKLIGLANKKYYSTRVKTFEESLEMESKPNGYEEIAILMMKGKLQDKEEVYQLCESLWTGLNAWFEEIGIKYLVEELPF